MGVGVARPARSIIQHVGTAGGYGTGKDGPNSRSAIQSGQLCSILCHVGVLSVVFVSLGARVVALEPNADCVRHIQLSYADRQIEVVQAAAGAKNGLAVLNVSDERDARSSVSDDWIKTMGKQDESYRGIWSGQNVSLC